MLGVCNSLFFLLILQNLVDISISSPNLPQTYSFLWYCDIDLPHSSIARHTHTLKCTIAGMLRNKGFVFSSVDSFSLVSKILKLFPLSLDFLIMLSSCISLFTSLVFLFTSFSCFFFFFLSFFLLAFLSFILLFLSLSAVFYLPLTC